MKDFDIRQVLRAYLTECHRHEDALIIEELGLNEDARADIAVVNGELNCFEIKSQADTLARLKRQRSAYDKFFDKVTLVVSSKHLTKARKSIPKWWGIIEVGQSGDRALLCHQREPQQNPKVSALSLARLLWRNEAHDVLASRGKIIGLRTKPRDVLCEKIAHEVPLDELKEIVRSKLKCRANWRSASPQTSNGGLSRLVAKSCHSPVRQIVRLHNRQ